MTWVREMRVGRTVLVVHLRRVNGYGMKQKIGKLRLL